MAIQRLLLTGVSNPSIKQEALGTYTGYDPSRTQDSHHFRNYSHRAFAAQNNYLRITNDVA